jgi:hypothetical protein
MGNRRAAAVALGLVCMLGGAIAAREGIGLSQSPNATTTALAPESLREWLTYLSSDDLEGRNTFSEGLGLAAAYISERLREVGVKPAGDHGTYFQRVSVLGVRSTNHSTLTVEVNGQTRTFRDGQGVNFPKNVGGKRTFTLNQVDFAGYGLNVGTAHNDYKGLNAKGSVVIWMGSRGPRSVNTRDANAQLHNRDAIAIEEMGAAATIAPLNDAAETRYAGSDERGNADFITVQRLDSPQPPEIGASDDFFNFLFSAADIKYPQLIAGAERQDDLPTFALKGVKLTFNLDADYQVIDTQYTRNVVGVVEGADPQLKNTYVAFGAHYDHLGYMRTALPAGSDRIYNGADDDGSGATTLIGIARTFAMAPRTKRSLLFVWHAGEERGLYGSRYFADHPAVPIENIVAQLNIDMIGRNRDNNPSQSNTVYAIGSDRISTELHNIMMDANSGLPSPVKIDFEMNAPTDPERLYYRSDHYSYASKGIPVIFFFTGLHPDYHQVTDSVDKILFDKMSHIGQLVYETGRRVANLDHPPVRDLKGPRAGKGSTGKLSED